MSYLNLLTVPATLHVAACQVAEDDHGNAVYGPTVDEDTTCYLAKQTSSESGAEGVQEETYRMFLPHDVPLTGWDRVTVRGFTYEVDGPPWQVIRALDGTVHHVEATVRRTA